MSESLQSKLFYWLVAITLTDSALVNITAAQFGSTYADVISGFLLYSATVLSLAILVSKKIYGKSLFMVLACIMFMAFYQKKVVHVEDVQLYNDFFVHGLGGLIIGYAIINHHSLLIKVARISVVFSILLITEPYTNSLMNMNNQSSGYILASFVIWLLVYYFYNKNKKLLYIIIPFSLLITLFSSRGCGLSIVVAWVALKIYELNKTQKRVQKTVRWLSLFALLSSILFLLSSQYIIDNKILTNVDSSFVGRYLFGGADNSSGRFEIWTSLLELINQNFYWGLGMGNDRFWIHNNLGYNSAHNIILEIILNFGVFFGSLLIFSYSRLIYKSVTSSQNTNYILLMIGLISMHIIRLLVSGSYISNSFELLLIAGIAARKIDSSYSKNK